MSAQVQSASSLALRVAHSQRIGAFYLLGLGCFVFFIYLAKLIDRYLYTRYLDRPTEQSPSQRKTLRYWLYNHVKLDLVYAPFFSTRHRQEVCIARGIHLGRIPTRLQAIIMTLLISINILLCTYDRPWQDNGAASGLKDFRARCGIMSTANLVPLMLLATVKNPLLWLLDVSFDKFNTFHKCFGHIVIVQALTHFVCAYITMQKKLDVGDSRGLIGNGYLAGVALLLILLLSPCAFRRRFYESFLYLHILLAVVVVVFLWLHLRTLKGINFLISTIAIWAFARLWRFATLVRCSFGGFEKKESWICQSFIEPLTDDALRVSICCPRPFSIGPGQYFYVTIPRIGWWTSHPFSIAWTSEDGEPTSNQRDENEEKTGRERENDTTTGCHSPKDTPFRVNMIVRKRSGLTSLLHQKALAHKPQTLMKVLSRISTRLEHLQSPSEHPRTDDSSDSSPYIANVLLEGPYGPSATYSMNTYHTVLLIAGGVGITHHLITMRTLLQRYRDRSTPLQKLTLLWVVRSEDHLDWIKSWLTELLDLAGSLKHVSDDLKVSEHNNGFDSADNDHHHHHQPIFNVEIHVSRPESFTKVKSFSQDMQQATIMSSRAEMQVFFGRPNLAEIITSQLEKEVGKMGVGVCGPAAMQDEVRKVVRSVGRKRDIGFVEAMFGW